MLSTYAKREALAIIAMGVMLATTTAVMHWWLISGGLGVLTLLVVAFFRDPDRSVPTQRGAVVAPSDGRVSSIHEVDAFEPFGEKAICIRLFLSLLDPHVTRSPCHAIVTAIHEKPGPRGNALRPESPEHNASVSLVLEHPVRRHPVAVVRHIAGLFARTLHVAVREQQIVQRGQKTGIIKLGSTVEVYLPQSLAPRIAVEEGQRVRGGEAVIAYIAGKPGGRPPNSEEGTEVTTVRRIEPGEAADDPQACEDSEGDESPANPDTLWAGNESQ